MVVHLHDLIGRQQNVSIKSNPLHSTKLSKEDLKLEYKLMETNKESCKLHKCKCKEN